VNQGLFKNIFLMCLHTGSVLQGPVHNVGPFQNPDQVDRHGLPNSTGVGNDTGMGDNPGVDVGVQVNIF
jgi:hypothetical protein